MLPKLLAAQVRQFLLKHPAAKAALKIGFFLKSEYHSLLSY